MTKLNEAREQAAEEYVNAREWPRKRESRDCYDTLMKYEIRDLLVEAHEDGQQVGEKRQASNIHLLPAHELLKHPAIQQMKEMLEKIKTKQGMCIYGSSDTDGNPEVAFRQGSFYAFNECAEIASEALAPFQQTTEGEEKNG